MNIVCYERVCFEREPNQTHVVKSKRNAAGTNKVGQMGDKIKADSAQYDQRKFRHNAVQSFLQRKK